MNGYVRYSSTYEHEDGDVEPAVGITIDVVRKRDHIIVEQVQSNVNGAFKTNSTYDDENIYTIKLNSVYRVIREDYNWYLLRFEQTKTPVDTDSFSDDSETEQVIQLPDIPLSGMNATLRLYRPGGYVDLDTVSVNFNIARSKMPLYGYKSVFFDGIAKGVIIGQGSFTLNMQNANQLNKHIDGSNILIPNTNLSLNLQYQKAGYSISSLVYQLRGIQINNVQQAVAASGEPIGETYGFISNYITGVNA